MLPLLRCYSPKFIDAVTFFSPVSLAVAIMAEADQVVLTQGDLRIVYVVCCQRYYVMHFAGRCVQAFPETIHAETTVTLPDVLPHVLPCLC